MSKRNWGTLKCGCGRDVMITCEVVKSGDGVQTVFDGKCECGRRGSAWYPEKVKEALNPEDYDYRYDN